MVLHIKKKWVSVLILVMYDSGYDLTKFDKILDDFDKIIGLDKLK